MFLRTKNQAFNRLNGRFKHKEFFMKNKIKFLGIIAIVAIIISLSMTSCEEIVFGGSLTIENKTSASIQAFAVSIESLGDISGATKTIESGKSYTWDFSMDGEVSYNWAGITSSLSTLNPKKIYISGGKKEVIPAN